MPRQFALGLVAAVIGVGIVIALSLGDRAIRPSPMPATIPTDLPPGLAPGAKPALAGIDLGHRRLADCDGGSTSRDPDPEAIGRREQAAMKTLDAISAELAGSTAAEDRALGLFVRLMNGSSRAHAQFAQQNPQCEQDPTCGPREDMALLQAARPDLDALTGLAASGRDAGAYELALSACGMRDLSSAGGACAQLSARQWAQIEPQNAQPWLFVASEAARQSQPALLEDAMFQASRAARNDARWDLFAKLLDARALRGQGVDVRNDVAFAAMGMTAAMRFAPFAPVFSHCSVAALADPNRRQVCDDLARLLTERSDTLVAFAVGTRLGERLGWPPARLGELRDLADAYRQLIVERDGDDPQSCASLGRQREWIGQALAHGEMAAVHRLVAGSGQTAAQLALRWRSAKRATTGASSPPADGP